MTLEPIAAAPSAPIADPLMRQTWSDLTFLHWGFDPDDVRPLIPKQLSPDLFDGAAWVGLVPFLITDLTLPRGPALPWLSRFLETNVRTYVVDRHGNRGVWFFSLDAARLAAVVGARIGFGLPYFWARMRMPVSGGSVHYRSARRQGGAGCDIEIAPGAEIASPTEFDHFLTARFRLYSVRRGRLMQAAVDHGPWSLQRADVISLRENLLDAAGLAAPGGAPIVHFTRGVNVLVGGPTAV